MKWLSTLCKVTFSLLLCSSASFFSSSVYAFVPAPVGYFSGATGNTVYSSASSLCTAAGYAQITGPFNQTVSTGPNSYGGDKMVFVEVGFEYGWCVVNSGSTNGPQFYQYSYCPSSGTTQVVNGHMQCEGDPPPDCPTAGTAKKDSIALSGISGQQGISAGMCAGTSGGDCGITCKSGIATYNDVSGQSSVYCESYEYTGSACTTPSLVATPVSSVPTQNQATPVNSPPKSKQDCPGGSGFAEVNNVGMCLPSGTNVTGAATTQTSTGGGSVSSTSTTTVNSNGTNTTTTTTTYKDAQGNVTYSGTGTATDGINQAGVPGQGDKPNLGDAPTFDPTLPQEATFNIKAQGNPVFSTEIFQTSASCPPDITYSVMGKDLSISFSSLCAYADVLRGIILMLSALVSMRVVVTS